MKDSSSTQYFNFQKEPEQVIRDIIDDVYLALKEKGYNPVSQIVGYVMSGDPTYITSYKNARAQIMQVERDEILEVLLKDYIEVHFQ